MMRELNSRPRLLRWHFDDKIETDNSEEWNWIEITMHFTDDSKRWSTLYVSCNSSCHRLERMGAMVRLM